MGRLTTHILDTRNGKPAGDVLIELYRRPDGERLETTHSNADGRCDRPLLEGESFTKGEYELVFHVGEYFRREGVNLPEPAFLERVVVRFGVADPAAHYHVPLLVSPWSYATYRGS
ncbi:MAG: hydroxyisourate hydrolase [Proteobacteria bacterium]|nr:MAG: hydroxyisourate hydrolase [Pseudomonadota bacterium]